jgi:hypothetical protein
LPQLAQLTLRLFTLTGRCPAREPYRHPVRDACTCSWFAAEQCIFGLTMTVQTESRGLPPFVQNAHKGWAPTFLLTLELKDALN